MAYAQDAKMDGGTSAGRTTAPWFANENDRLIKNLTELALEKLAKVLPPPTPTNAQTGEVAVNYANSELSQQLRDQNSRLENLIRVLDSVDL